MLLALADELGGFTQYVGGPDFAFSLLPPLETLASVEETVVREKAVEALCKVGETFPREHVVEHYLEMLKRLAGGDWFTSRVSSCGLFATAYAHVPAEAVAGGGGGGGGEHPTAAAADVRAQLRCGPRLHSGHQLVLVGWSWCP